MLGTKTCPDEIPTPRLPGCRIAPVACRDCFDDGSKPRAHINLSRKPDWARVDIDCDRYRVSSSYRGLGFSIGNILILLSSR
jgi:hypothetical protein